MPHRPRLALVGAAPAAAQMRIAADRLGWKSAPEPSADLVYVVSGNCTDLVRLARTGAHLAVDLDLVADLGAEALGDVVAAATGSVRRGEPLASAPAVAQWLRTVRDTPDISHLSGLSRSPSLHVSMIGVALYAARAAGWVAAPTVSSGSTGHLELRFTTSAGERRIALDLARETEELPQWELQAASRERVARVALLPEPRLEINGDETVLPAEHPAGAFGQEAFLRGWWRAVEEGVPARNDPVYVAALSDAARRISA